jgi:hypothetical protein
MYNNINEILNYRQKIYKPIDLTILNVIYGANDKYIDITDKIKELFLKENQLFIPKETNFNQLFSDPCFCVQKEIKIDALINNVYLHICEKEIESHLLNDVIIDTNIYPINNHDLTIQKVEYGANDQYLDITNKIKELFLKEKTLFIPKETNFNQLFTDPCFCVQKEIKIDAIVNNEPVYIYEKEIDGFLSNNVIINPFSFFTVNNLLKDVNNFELIYLIIKNFNFIEPICEIANNFVKKNQISINENINILYLCFDDNYIITLSNFYNKECITIKQELQDKYIQLINKYFNKNDKIIIIGNDTDDNDNDNDNNIINYLQCNNYNYFIRNDKTNDNIYETAVDFEIACFCNDIFIGIDETIFSQFINTKIQNKKTILINYINESISENVINKTLL